MIREHGVQVGHSSLTALNLREGQRCSARGVRLLRVAALVASLMGLASGAAALELESPIAGVDSPYNLILTSAFDHSFGDVLVAEIPVVGSPNGLVAGDSRTTAYTGESGWTTDPPASPNVS